MSYFKFCFVASFISKYFVILYNDEKTEIYLSKLLNASSYISIYLSIYVLIYASSI